MDLALWLHHGRVRGILDLIDQLPRTARLWSAAAMDEELAEAQLLHEAETDAQDEAPEWTPPLGEWNLVAQMLSVVIGELRSLRQTTISAAGGRPRQEKPFPSPRTARDTVQARLDSAYADDVAADFGF